MQITGVNSLYTQNIAKNVVASKNGIQKQNKMPYSSFANLPASVYQANFCPAFGRYKKVEDISLFHRDTKKLVPASLLKETIGDSVFYKIMVKREEAGYLDMDCDAILPEDGFLSDELDNNIPKVRHLRSILGDEYAGIGTELINAAINESKKRGKNGSLWLKTEKGYAHSLSDYRKNENPIPFYYKLGFRSMDKEMDSFIKRCIKTSNYFSLPPSEILLLSSAKVEDFNKYYSKYYSKISSAA